MTRSWLQAHDIQIDSRTTQQDGFTKTHQEVEVRKRKGWHRDEFPNESFSIFRMVGNCAVEWQVVSQNIY
jgi:hypothetical protein